MLQLYITWSENVTSEQSEEQTLIYSEIIMCPCRLISCNKYHTLVEDADYGEAVHVWGRESYGKSAPLAQICCEPESSPKLYF